MKLATVFAAEAWAQQLFWETLAFIPGYHWSLHTRTPIVRPVGDVVLVLHWHAKLDAGLVAYIPCYGFHASDLPYFRGGSPIENQQCRGITDTMLTCFRLDAGIDTGPICAKLPLSLAGSREDVLDRIAGLVARMVPPLLAGAYTETPQAGAGSFYTRADVIVAP